MERAAVFAREGRLRLDLLPRAGGTSSRLAPTGTAGMGGGGATGRPSLERYKRRKS